MASRSEDGIDAVRGHDHPGGANAIKLQQVRPRALRYREHASSALDGARNDGPKDDPVGDSHQRRRTLEGEVVNGDHRRTGTLQRERVLKMREGRTQTS